MTRPRTLLKGKTGTGTSRRSDRSRRRELVGPDPIIRVGLMEEYDRIDFTLYGPFDLVDLSGETVEKGLESDQRWHIVPDKTTEARAVYSVLTTAFAKRDSADQLRKALALKNHAARIVEVGEEIFINGRLITNNIKYRVLVGRWPTEREAKSHLPSFQEEFAPRIIRQVIKPSAGTLELFNEDYTDSRFVEDGLRLIPASPESRIKLYNVREGTGFHWEREVDRFYDGTIEIRLDPRALLMSLTELPLEQYLKGVVPAEMPASYPQEALKAQAVAARSEALAKIGVKHLNDPFDLCGTVHCQVYTGCTNLDGRASRAVEDTRGMVMMMNSTVVESVFSSCCGGHTENKINVWNPPGAAHLEGKWDCEKDAPDENDLDLSNEMDARKWIQSSPSVWCNVSKQDVLPRSLTNASKYFRWQVSYTRRELEEIIRKKSGEDIGALVNIIPIHRGVSGRLMEIEIQGARRNINIKRELNIRRALSTSYLYSACFIVDVEYSEDARPINFVFTGAGWGHGVGMCQVGAGVMAVKGHSFDKILAHYYPGTKVEKVYGE